MPAQSLPNGLIELIVIASGLEQRGCLTHYSLRITSDHGKCPMDADNVAWSVRNEDALSGARKNFSRKAKPFRGFFPREVNTMDTAVPEDAPIRHGSRRRLAFDPDHPTV